MRLILALLIVAAACIAPAEARRARDGFGTTSQCHCDRYLNPHHLPASRSPYGVARSRRY